MTEEVELTGEEFKQKILLVQKELFKHCKTPAQAAAVALTIAVDVIVHHTEARDVVVGLDDKAWRVTIKETRMALEAKESG